MQFDEYQASATKTGDFGNRTNEWATMYLCMGLAGETGEVIEKLKKVMRNNGGVMSEDQRSLIKLELGDVLWYLSQLARMCDLSFEEVAQANIEKLRSRAERGVIKSEGDTR